MTNGWIDIKNTDMMLIMGGNPAENHPCGFKCQSKPSCIATPRSLSSIRASRAPRRNADLFLQIRAGADIAFLGDWSLRHPEWRIAHDYLVYYTNAAFHREGRLQASGGRAVLRLRRSHSTYDKATWNYEPAGDLTPKDVAAGAAIAARRASCRGINHPRMQIDAQHKAGQNVSAFEQRVRRQSSSNPGQVGSPDAMPASCSCGGRSSGSRGAGAKAADGSNATPMLHPTWPTIFLCSIRAASFNS